MSYINLCKCHLHILGKCPLQVGQTFLIWLEVQPCPYQNVAIIATIYVPSSYFIAKALIVSCREAFMWTIESSVIEC